MFTQVEIINIGMTKIGASPIERIDPPRTNVERYVAVNYKQWKRSELTKRRWVFATEDHVALAQAAYVEGREQPYKYALPVECLRPIRQNGTEWKQRGRFVWSAYPTLSVSMVVDVEEEDFDPLFVDVLAARIAYDSAEYVTQSNTKKSDAYQLYRDAVDIAGKTNAFVIGPEYINDDDAAYPFLTARY